MNVQRFRIVQSSILVAAALTLCACSILNWKRERVAVPAPSADSTPVEAKTRSYYEQRLHEEVRDRLRRSGTQEDPVKAKLVRRDPYFFKEYSVYPDGAASYSLEIKESDSRTSPYSSDVTVRKQRYSTRYHRKKEPARADSDFIRETGLETLSFKIRYGRWMEVGSLFRPELTEENINGEYVPVRPGTERLAVAEDEDRGFMRRMWSKVTGR